MQHPTRERETKRWDEWIVIFSHGDAGRARVSGRVMTDRRRGAEARGRGRVECVSLSLLVCLSVGRPWAKGTARIKTESAVDELSPMRRAASNRVALELPPAPQLGQQRYHLEKRQLWKIDHYARVHSFRARRYSERLI